MIKQVDGSILAAQIRFVRQVQKGTILLVEGELDAKVFEKFIDGAQCDIEVANGKRTVLDALDLLEDEGFPGIVAIVDADFDRLIGVTYPLENLCLTDLHDLDLTIFASTALDLYIAEHADKASFAKTFKSDMDALRKSIIEASLPIAYCRIASQRRNLNVYFKDIRHDQLVDLHSLSVDTATLIDQLISRSACPCDAKQLKAHVDNEAARNHDIRQLANGHDVAAILGIALRKVLANRKDPQTWASEIEAGLRLAFHWEAMIGTGLYKWLREWEVKNAPRRIFRAHAS